MVVKSILRDERIDAFNASMEISIGEYLEFAKSIIDNNEFQRKKVIKSKIKEILKEDLLRGCLIPPIVLATTNSLVTELNASQDINVCQSIIDKSVENLEILIIDGLQRTYVMMELEEELSKSISDSKVKEENLKKLDVLYKHKFRAEVYLGLSRVGLLYRMITLNTGQTTMSTRHLMEILYFDYSRIGIDGIKLTTDKEETRVSDTLDEFNFKTVLDGFNSYLERDESLIEKTEILDNIKSLEVLNNEEGKKDLFKEFVLTFRDFLQVMQGNLNYWTFDATQVDDALKLNANPFGKTVLDIFKKSQVLTGFGAALGSIKEREGCRLGEINRSFQSIKVDGADWQYAIYQMLKHLDLIKEKSKKIGNDQRFYFRSFFKGLFDRDGEVFLNFNKASEYAYNRTRIEKDYK
ncbi:hypothetical protein [Sphingobacterium sp. xlx-130]|uniref:hypothetical protein n=1 Tax=Sphingobacterium sp. xlx-130 TaxID=2654323 RepID=UPI0013DD8501|nr:hypothetical protein [Sphingobacterium sp. xlx-130]